MSQPTFPRSGNGVEWAGFLTTRAGLAVAPHPESLVALATGSGRILRRLVRLPNQETSVANADDGTEGTVTADATGRYILIATAGKCDRGKILRWAVGTSRLAVSPAALFEPTEGPVKYWTVVTSYISPKASKGQPSSIEGHGLMAIAPIAKDEIVAIRGGHIVDMATMNALPDRLRYSDVQIADGFYLVALDEAEYESVMLFINHSCEPNVGFAGNIVLVAMREVSPGEELTMDYALFDDYDGEMECLCGTASCRHTINGRDWQRPELQDKYENYFSTYLLNRLSH